MDRTFISNRALIHPDRFYNAQRCGRRSVMRPGPGSKICPICLEASKTAGSLTRVGKRGNPRLRGGSDPSTSLTPELRVGYNPSMTDLMALSYILSPQPASV